MWLMFVSGENCLIQPTLLMPFHVDCNPTPNNRCPSWKLDKPLFKKDFRGDSALNGILQMLSLNHKYQVKKDEANVIWYSAA